MSLATAARIARAAAADGLSHPDIKALGKLGKRGATAHNQRGDFKRVFPDTAMCKAKDTIKTPIKHDIDGVKWEEVSILYPHHVFATLYVSYPDAFQRREESS